MYLNIYFTIDSNYGVKTVSNPPTKCTREIHTRAHNSQMHTRDPHACTQFTNAHERSTRVHTIHKCTREIHTRAHNPEMHARDPHTFSDRSSKRKKEKKKNI